jgi:GNAT superfamily N-acetyltransferase
MPNNNNNNLEIDRSKIEIKEVDQSKLDEVFYIIRSCAEDLAKNGKDHWASYYNSPQKLIEKFEHGKVFLLYVEGKPVGTVSLSAKVPDYYIETIDGEVVDYTQLFKDPNSTEALYQSALGVHPDYQNFKLGKELIKMSEDWATKNGYRYMRFDTRNDHLLEFYARNRYAQKGEMLDGDVKYYLLEKDLQI